MAIKILDKTKLDQKTQRLLSREISSMEKLHHPNVIRLYEVVETLSKLHLVMEYAGGGELFGKISTEGKLSEPESKLIFSQIVSAVKHMVSGGEECESRLHPPHKESMGLQCSIIQVSQRALVLQGQKVVPSGRVRSSAGIMFLASEAMPRALQ